MKIYKRTERVTWYGYGYYSVEHTVEVTKGFYLNLEDAKEDEEWDKADVIDETMEGLILKSKDIYEDEAKYSIEYIYEIEVQE